MVFGILLTLFGIGAACALLYNAMVYALPVGLGMWAGFALMHAGAGAVEAIGVGLLVGGIVFAIGNLGFHATQSVMIRLAIAALFVIPAAYVGYTGTLEVSALGMLSSAWEHVVAVIGAVAIGGTAFARLVTGVDVVAQKDAI